MKYSQLETGQAFTCTQYPDTLIRCQADRIHGAVAARNGALVWIDGDPDVTLAEYTGPMEACDRCGYEYPRSIMNRKSESYYDWDNSDSDVQGSIAQTREFYVCLDRAACRDGRRVNAEVAQMSAESEDAAMREAGWGAIGNGARGVE